MIYYHLRYNIYPPPGFPVEKEEWWELSKKHNEQQAKWLLGIKHNTKVSIILLSEICSTEYQSKKSAASNEESKNLKLNNRNLKNWQLAEPANILRKLNDDDALINQTYRNIVKPAPLL